MSIFGEFAERKGWHLSCLALCGLGSSHTMLIQTNIYLVHTFGTVTLLGGHCSRSIQCFEEGHRRGSRERQVAGLGERGSS